MKNLIQFLRLGGTLQRHDAQRNNAEQQLFSAHCVLAHLVEMYDSGRWRSYYKEDAFAEAVRGARQAVDHWTKIVSLCGGSSSAPR